MERESIVSSLIASAGYDDKLSILEIEFKDGAIWQYHQFQPYKWEAFRKAKSKGGYFTAHVKGRHFGRAVGRVEREKVEPAPVVATPIYLALLQVQKLMRHLPIDRLGRMVWMACGKNNTRFEMAMGLLDEAACDIASAIALAKERRL
jgi:hypothetical protein